MILAIVLAILGLLLGVAIDDEDTAIIGGLIGFSLGFYLSLGQRLTKLEKRVTELSELQAIISTAQPPITSPVPHSEPLPTAAPVQEEIRFAPETQEAPAAEEALNFDFTLPPDEVKPEPEPPPPPNFIDRGLQALKGFFTGGNPMVRIGVVVLFFGVAFLLRYAAERAWIPIELRIAGVALGGLAMIALGWRLRSRRAGYGLVLQGGGIGIVYLTVFAAFRLYNLLPPTLAFAVLIACALLSSLIAVLQNARSLAVLSVAGGFLAPILTSTGQGSHVALFSYYLVLNLAIFGIAWFKAWRLLNLVGFVFTFGIASLWGYRYYQAEYFATTEPFLVLFFLFYVAITVLFAFRQPPRLKGYVDGTIVFGTPLVGFALQAALVADFDYGLAWSALILGGFYLGLSWALLHRAAAGMRVLAEAFLAIGIVFTSLAIPLGLDARWTSAMWALEGAALVWIGVRQQRLGARLFGLLLVLGAGFFHALASLFDYYDRAFANSWYLGVVIIAASALFCAYFPWRHRDALKPWESYLVPLLFAWGLLWWLVGGLFEIGERLPWRYRYGSVLLLFAVTAALAQILRARLDWPLARLPALGLLPALALTLAASAWDLSHPFAQLGYLGWPLALGVHYMILYRNDSDDLSPYLRWLHAGGLWLALIVITWELAWDVDRLTTGSDTWPLTVWGLAPSLAAFALLSWGRHIRWPCAEHADVYLGLGGVPVAVYLWLWIIGANLLGPADPQPLPYMPLLNPLDIAVGYALLVLLRWLQAGGPLSRTLRIDARLILAVTAFFWLNAILIRTLHHWGGVPFDFDAMSRSVLVQAALSILWSLSAVALMLFAARRERRALWLVGAGLMAVVVIKLFLVDLAATGTVERIVAFMAVGGLLLLVGYFAPVPPRADKADNEEPTPP